MATALLSWLSYRGVRHALEAEMVRRLENVAGVIAAQVSADDVADARLLGEDGAGYGHLQVVLEELRAMTRAANASLIDRDRVALYDCRGPEHQFQVSRLDTLVRAPLAAALAGATRVSEVVTIDAEPRRVAFAPVAGAGVVVAVVAVELPVEYLPVLADFRRTLLLTAALLAAALGLLAAVVVHGAVSAARLERRLSRAENLAAMGRLTATLAHEIKNPLAVIRGAAQRLGRLEPEARRMSEFVVAEADRLTRTVGRYLQFARGDAVPAGPGDAGRALAETLDLLEGEARARRVELERPAATAARAVRLDNESLKQVYLNLMLNALEAMPDGGRLAVTLRDEPAAVEVTFSDSGPGIPEEVLRQMGDPFYTTKAQGSGLGLFLTRRLVESAGGRLAIRSRPGAGTTAVVRLPRAGG